MYVVYDSATNVQQIKATYNGDTITKDIYTNGTNRWMNIQIQAKPNTIMTVHVFDIETFSLESTAVLEFLNIGSFTNGTVAFQNTVAPLGVYLGELKIYELDLEHSKGITYRRYNLINDIPSSMLEYVRITEGSLVTNAHNGTVSSITVNNTIPLPFDFSEIGHKITATQGEFAECTIIGCEYCQIVDSAYNDLCRICDITYTECTPSTICPVDYFMHVGICRKCPIGCSECSSLNTCTACDSGLVLTTNDDDSVSCICPAGEYGIEDVTTDTLTCTACDTS